MGPASAGDGKSLIDLLVAGSGSADREAAGIAAREGRAAGAAAGTAFGVTVAGDGFWAGRMAGRRISSDAMIVDRRIIKTE
jgi:hypothetical protein